MTTQQILDLLLRDQSISKPVYQSLSKIVRQDDIRHIEGSCGKHKSLTPFSVRFASGKILCRANGIHEYAKELETTPITPLIKTPITPLQRRFMSYNNNAHIDRALSIAKNGEYSILFVAHPDTTEEERGIIVTFAKELLGPDARVWLTTEKDIQPWMCRNADITTEILPFSEYFPERQAAWKDFTDAISLDYRSPDLFTVLDIDSCHRLLMLAKQHLNIDGIVTIICNDTLQATQEFSTIINIARTIAQMDDMTTIKPEHVAEAIQYKSIRGHLPN